MLCTTTRQTLVGYSMVAALTDALIFLVGITPTSDNCGRRRFSQNLLCSTDKSLNPWELKAMPPNASHLDASSTGLMTALMPKVPKMSRKTVKRKTTYPWATLCWWVRKLGDCGHTFLGKTPRIAILDSGTPDILGELNGISAFWKPYQKNKQMMKIWTEVWTYKFGNGNKLKLLYTVPLLHATAVTEVSIITDVDSDLPLLLSKDAMERARMCLNFKNDSVTIFGRKVPMKCMSSGHYHIPILRPLLDSGKFNQIFFINKNYNLEWIRKS